MQIVYQMNRAIAAIEAVQAGVAVRAARHQADIRKYFSWVTGFHDLYPRTHFMCWVDFQCSLWAGTNDTLPRNILAYDATNG